ncbi:hypothetical protein F2Q70_00018359 [Brassica cretica]|uniref:Uncharacterized protein n=1 Tax=Brassica cretica TaxID=69181 RepID=A0A8S9I2W9_BRACR|nr:hypothetical protein F2Q70_00018359 [Brassica cretica]KAF2599909.1 hypothetical protein F2Q68_00011624 [Brassica cretica]
MHGLMSYRCSEGFNRYTATELRLDPDCYRPSGTSARSLRSDRVGRALGRYVATELWLELGRFVATELGLGLGCYAATGQSVCVLHLPFYYLFWKYDLRGFSGGNSVVTVFDPNSTHRTSVGVRQHTHDVRGCPWESVSTHRTSVGVRQYTHEVRGCPRESVSTHMTSVAVRVCLAAHTGRPWQSISTHRTSVAVHQYTYQHAGPSRGWFRTSVAVRQHTQDVRGLSISTHISTLALPVDCSGDFGTSGLSVQYTQDVHGCPSAHTGRPWLSVSTHSKSADRPSVHISAR